MMDVEEWVKLTSQTGIAVALMILGIRWLLRDRDGILHSLNSERDKRIDALTKASEECATDRANMHAEMKELQKEVRSLMGQIINGLSKQISGEKGQAD